LIIPNFCCIFAAIIAKMKILFLTYHGFEEASGISKKMLAQIKGLRQNGHDVRLCYYGFADDGHRCRYIDDVVIKDYGKGGIAGLRQRLDYNCIYEYCVREKIEFVYARCFQNANPWLIRFFKKLRKAGIHAVTEIPTYPYDQEFTHFEWKMRAELKMDQIFRNKLYQQMDALVTFSDAERIFGQRTIRISNGVDLDSIPLHQPSTISHQPSGLHLIGVAEVHDWHGFDRVMTGIGKYYRQKQIANSHQPDVYFHVVGGVHPNRMTNVFLPIIKEYGLQDRIIFHGQLFGDELTNVFNLCQFAIGSLGRHRSGITVIKTLKNREYATRGIPFIYSEQDSDFDHQPYVLKAPADESPVNIQHIIDFMKDFQMKPAEIRRTVEHLSWKIQMQMVVEQMNSF
jgi:glycosyltransferase involved in cell wall biosynthesis